MHIDEFPYCCTAKIITDFGQEYPDDDLEYSVEDIIEYLNQRIPNVRDDGNGVVVAITTSNQKNAAEALTRLGFYTNEKPMKKGRNRDTGDLFIWFMPTHEFKPVKI